MPLLTCKITRMITMGVFIKNNLGMVKILLWDTNNQTQGFNWIELLFTSFTKASSGQTEIELNEAKIIHKGIF